MAVHFRPLTIKNIKRETDDCVSISFNVPQELSDEFEFKEGQNITLKKMINGQEYRRSYSICAAPHDNELKVAIKKVAGGIFSVFANEQLKKGDVLDVLPPTGKFTARLTETQTGNYLAIASGSGITPVISIIKHTLQTQDHSQFILLYGNRSRSSIIFFEELEALKNKYMQRFTLINVLSRERTDAEINFGRINKEKLIALQHIVPYNTFDSIYICGPEEMIFSAGDYFNSLRIDKHKIHFELFTTPGGPSSNKALAVEASESLAGKAIVTVKLDGRSFNFPLAENGLSVLDAALQFGADLPYACKGGVCASCRAKLVSGSVHMDVNYALEEEEVAAGFILTCQSHPRSQAIELDFDVK